MPGEATDVGKIIGYLVLERSDWDRGLDEAGRKADELGRHSPKIKIDTNAAQAIATLATVAAAEDKVGKNATTAKPFVVNLWGALAAIAPAALPIAGVLSGAFIGALPTVAALIIGIKGISDEMKSGALAGTVYAQDISTLQGEWATLKQTAAGGLLPGIDQAVRTSSPLFKVLNGDIGVMSAQIGHIAGSAAPALLTIFTELNPLFVTFGNLIDRGAGELEHWAQSSTGVSSFVAYTQAELPQVMQMLGNLVQLFGHVVQAAAPMGGVILGGLELLVRVLDELPIGTLQTLVPLLVAGYAALKTYEGVTTIVGGVNRALASMATAAAGGAAAERAAALESTAAAAQRRASILADNAAIAESTAGSTAEQIAAYQAASAAATTAAERTAVAAATAAAEVDAAGEAASIGWAGFIPVLGAAAVGLGILTGAFGGGQKAAMAVKQAEDSYAESVKESTDALNQANIAQTNKNLADDQSLQLLDQLNDKNHELSISYGDLTAAINGSATQFGAVQQKLAQEGLKDPFTSQGHAALSLFGNVATLRQGLQAQIKTQEQLNVAAEQSLGLNDQQAASAARLYGLVGVDGVNAYLAATQAAQKSTDQARQQTIQWQMEGDAADLLKQAIDALSGKQLDAAQAENQFEQSILSLAQGVQGGSTALTGMSAAAVTNRGNLISAAQSAETAAEAYGNVNKSGEAGRQKLIQLRQQLIDGAVAAGENRTAVTQLIDSILKIPAKADTNIQTNADKVAATIDAFQRKVDGLHGKVITVSVDATGAIDAITQVGDMINHISGGVSTGFSLTGSGKQGNAYGGTVLAAAGGMTVPGFGGPKSDNVLSWLSPGEEVVQNPWASKYRPALKAMNSGQFDGYMAARGGSAVGSVSRADIAAIARETAAATAAAVMANMPPTVLKLGDKDVAKSADRGARLLARRD